MRTVSSRIRRAAIDLGWSLWRELGVAGVLRRHAGVAVVPEPLIIFTAALGDRDPRLRDEAMAWCLRHESLLSPNQVRQVFAADHWEVRHLADFAATLALGSPTRLPGWEQGDAFPLPDRRAKRAGPFLSASQLPLRLRALLGTGARAEVLRVLLADPGRAFTATQIAQRAQYTKRHVNEAFLQLETGGLLHVDRSRTPHHVRLTRGAELSRLLQPMPTALPDLAPLFRIVISALETIERHGALEPPRRAAHMHAVVREHEPALRRTQLWPLPPGHHGVGVHDPTEWFVHLAEHLAAGTVATADLVAAASDTDASAG